MASRRNRIVVKPNLKPAVSKSATAQKAKATIISTLHAPTVAESASIGGKNTVTPTPPEKYTIPVAAEAENKKSNEKGVVELQSSGDVDGGSENGDMKQKLNAHLLKKNVVSNPTEELSRETNRPDKTIDGSTSSVSIEEQNTGGDTENANSDVLEDESRTRETDVCKGMSSEPVVVGDGTTLPTSHNDGDDVTNTHTFVNDNPDASEQNDDDDQIDAEASSSKTKGVVTAEGPDLTIEEEAPQPKAPRKKREKKERKDPLPPSDKSPDRHKMRMSDLIIWNPAHNYFPKKKKTTSNPVKKEERPKTPESIASVDDEESNQSSSLPAPRVMIGPDGNIILDTQSLIIETPKEDTEAKTIIEEDDDDKYLNSNSYRKTSKTKMWTEKENEKFFMGLSMCGTDFSLMCNLLPKRSRRELKNKFRREEKRNRGLIDKALSCRQPYDMTPFEKMAEEESAKLKAAIEIKKEGKRRCIVEKQKKIKKERGRQKKRKVQESEDEEDDWGEEPEYEDEEEEENQSAENGDNHGTSAAATRIKKRKLEKADRMAVDSEVVVNEVVINNDGSVDSMRPNPFMFTPIEGSTNQTVVEEEEVGVHSRLLSDQRLQNGAAASSFVPSASPTIQPPLPQLQRMPQGIRHDAPNPASGTLPTRLPGAQSTSNIAGGSNSGLAATGSLRNIPGSAPIQIEMEGVTTPMQGVLIPSHIVPQLAPQLGIPQSSTPMQVLLVQEEGGTGGGKMVHVYVLPEKDNSSPFPQTGHGRVASDGSGQGLTLTSPIASPHPPHRRPSAPSTPTTPASPFSSPHPGQQNLQSFPFKSPPQASSTSSGHLSDSETSMSTIRNVYGTAMNSLTTAGAKERERMANPSAFSSSSSSSTVYPSTLTHTLPLPPPPPLMANNATHNSPNTQHIPNTYPNPGTNFPLPDTSTNRLTVLSSHHPPQMTLRHALNVVTPPTTTAGSTLNR